MASEETLEWREQQLELANQEHKHEFFVMQRIQTAQTAIKEIGQNLAILSKELQALESECTPNRQGICDSCGEIITIVYGGEWSCPNGCP